jgi:5-methylcytosine-specific restriction endonuclease McrA
VSADPKPGKRIRDPGLFKLLHARGVTCVLCGRAGQCHHVYPRGQGGDDVYENLVGLCGRCHDLLHGANEHTLVIFGEYISKERPDVLAYIQRKLGHEEGLEWLRQRFRLAV